MKWKVRKVDDRWQVTTPSGEQWGDGYVIFANAIREASYLASRARRHPGVFR